MMKFWIKPKSHKLRQTLACFLTFATTLAPHAALLLAPSSSRASNWQIDDCIRGSDCDPFLSTATPSVTPSFTDSPTATDTNTEVPPGSTQTWTITESPTYTESETFTPTQSFSESPSETSTPTSSSTRSSTPTPSPSRTITQTPTERPTPDGNPPVAQISLPLAGGEVFGLIGITGTASSGALDHYRLEYKMVGGSTWTEFARGHSSVVSGWLGNLDPTLLLNGFFEIKLTAQDIFGFYVESTRILTVKGEQKIGNFSLSFTDLEIPAGLLPIQAIRSYDSRDREKGDFGIGWRMAINDIRLQETGPIGEGWENTRDTCTILQLPKYCTSPTMIHRVNIAMPGGKLLEFDVSLNKQCQTSQPDRFPVVFFTPRPGTVASLEISGMGSQAQNDSEAPGMPGCGSVESFLVDDNGQIYDPFQYRLILEDGTVFILNDNPAGSLEKIIEPNGTELTFSPSGITSNRGQSVNFTRDGQGRITRITDPMGKAMTYSYDGAGDLVAVTDRDGGVTRMTYVNHRLATIKDPLGNTPIQNQYDASGRLRMHTDAFGKTIEYTHDLAAKEEVVKDRTGAETRYTYNFRGDVLSSTNAEGETTTYKYDAFGNKTFERNGEGEDVNFKLDSRFRVTHLCDALGNTLAFSYNTRGQALTITDALGRITRNGYDLKGNLVNTVDAQGNATQFYFEPQFGTMMSQTDAMGNITTYSYNGAAQMTSETNSLGIRTEYVYDSAGRRTLVKRIRPDGNEATGIDYDGSGRVVRTNFSDGSFTRTVYDAAGRQKETFDQLNRKTSYFYDLMGRLLRTEHPDGTYEENTYDDEGRRLTLRDRGGQVVTYEYDLVGRLRFTRFNDLSYTELVYDNAGRVKEQYDARRNKTSFEYDAVGRRKAVVNALNQRTEFTYDNAGNQVSLKDALNHTTTYEYDALNRRTKVNFPAHPVNGVMQATFTQTTYDALGRRIKERDQTGRETLYTYDSLNRLTKVTPNALDSATFWTYSYDAAGNQLTQVDAKGRITRFEYNLLNRRTARILPLLQREEYTYYADGSLHTRTDFNGKTTTYTYDLAKRLIRRSPDASFSEPDVEWQYFPSGLRKKMTDASGVTDYSYDLRQRLTRKTHSLAGVLHYNYDTAGNITKVYSDSIGGFNVDYIYDALNRVETANGSSYTYDAVGNLKTVSYPNTVTTTYNYDDVNRLNNLSATDSSGLLRSFDYFLKANGMRTRLSESTGRVSDWGYDAFYRVTSESTTGAPISGTTSYTYDAVNRLSRNSTIAGVMNYTITNDNNDRRSDQTYNQNGTVVGANGHAFDFDAEDRLTGMDGGTVDLVYDGDGNLVQKSNGGNSYTFLVDTNNLTGYAQIVEMIREGTLAYTFTFGANGIISQTDVAAGATSYFGKDGSNNTRYLTSANGTVTDSFDFSVDGILVGRTGQTLTFHLFQGEFFDAALGLYWLRSRWMNPQSGTFMGPDTYEGQQEDPASLHKYAFANWDGGINGMDPSGHTYLSIGNVMAAVSVISVLSSSFSATRALQRGDYQEAALNIAFLALDFAGVGIIEKAFHRLGLAGTKALRGTIESYLAWGKRNFMIRHLYKARFGQAKETIEALAKSGAKVEDVAKEAHRLRQVAQSEARALMSADEVAELEAKNIADGFAKEGPTLEQLYIKYGQNWTKVIEGSFKSNRYVDMLFLIFY